MLHYKAFTSAACRDDIGELEKMVNAWLEETQPLIHTMTQSPAGASVVISFLYELEDDDDPTMNVAIAEAPVEASGRELDLTSADALMITLLPHAELPY